MPYDASGTFTRLRGGDSWKGDATAGTKIKSDLHDSNDNDLASGLSECLTKTGKSQPLVDMPWNGKRITNLGEPLNDTDAATKAYADLPKPSTTGLTISGADANGRLTFSSPTGANGLSFTGADLSWLARLATTTPTVTVNRMVLNDKPDGSGTDVASINENGSMKLTGNLTTDGNVIATSVLGVKAAAGNVHLWLYGPNNEDRGVIYTNAAASGSVNLRVGGAQNFSFNTSGTFNAPSNVYAGGAFLETNGNTQGSIWTNWGHVDAYNAISARIEARAIAWANDRVANLQYRRVSMGSSGANANWVSPAGCCVVGYDREGGGSGQVRGLYYMYLQAYDPVRGWVGFSG